MTNTKTYFGHPSPVTDREIAAEIRHALELNPAVTTLYRSTTNGRFFGGFDVVGYYANSYRVGRIDGCTGRRALARVREIITRLGVEL